MARKHITSRWVARNHTAAWGVLARKLRTMMARKLITSKWVARNHTAAWVGLARRRWSCLVARKLTG